MLVVTLLKIFFRGIGFYTTCNMHKYAQRYFSLPMKLFDLIKNMLLKCMNGHSSQVWMLVRVLQWENWSFRVEHMKFLQCKDEQPCMFGRISGREPHDGKIHNWMDAAETWGLATQEEETQAGGVAIQT